MQQCRLQHVATQRNNVLQLTVSIGWGASGGVAAGRPHSGCATASFAIGTRERGASGQPCGDQLERRKLIPLLVKARRWACRRPRWQHLTTAHRYRDVLEARQCGQTGSGRDVATVCGGGPDVAGVRPSPDADVARKGSAVNTSTIPLVGWWSPSGSACRPLGRGWPRANRFGSVRYVARMMRAREMPGHIHVARCMLQIACCGQGRSTLSSLRNASSRQRSTALSTERER